MSEYESLIQGVTQLRKDTTMATMTARLSGKDQATEPVDGFNVGAFFIHHPICPTTEHMGRLWTVSHTVSGQNLGAYFKLRTDVEQFAREMHETYDGTTSAKDLVEQFRNRGSKPSVVQIGERNNMEPW